MVGLLCGMWAVKWAGLVHPQNTYDTMRTRALEFRVLLRPKRHACCSPRFKLGCGPFLHVPVGSPLVRDATPRHARPALSEVPTRGLPPPARPCLLARREPRRRRCRRQSVPPPLRSRASGKCPARAASSTSVSVAYRWNNGFAFMRKNTCRHKTHPIPRCASSAWSFCGALVVDCPDPATPQPYRAPSY